MILLTTNVLKVTIVLRELLFLPLTHVPREPTTIIMVLQAVMSVFQHPLVISLQLKPPLQFLLQISAHKDTTVSVEKRLPLQTFVLLDTTVPRVLPRRLLALLVSNAQPADCRHLTPIAPQGTIAIKELEAVIPLFAQQVTTVLLAQEDQFLALLVPTKHILKDQLPISASLALIRTIAPPQL